MTRHTTELRFTSSDHRHGVLYNPNEPAVYVEFTVSRMNNQVSFKHNGSANHWSTQAWIGAARRLMGSTAGITMDYFHDAIMNRVYYVTVKRGNK